VGTEAEYRQNFADRSRSFGGAAEVYDRVRPGYPDALFAHVAAQLPGPRVLEVGSGTGIATRGLTALGLDVTCIEPDPQMADVLARRMAGGPPVRIERQTFESARLDGPYDGLISAQAWHWTDHTTNLDRAARLLRPDGFLGLVWNGGKLHPEAAFQVIEALYDDAGLAGADRPREPIGTAAGLANVLDPQTWPGDQLAAHPQFRYDGTTLFTWQQVYSADDYTALLYSTSFYRVMDDNLRRDLLAAIAGVIREQFSDALTIEWFTQCYNARRLDPAA
jgi:SAM-dependent methyltransferase